MLGSEKEKNTASLTALSLGTQSPDQPAVLHWAHGQTACIFESPSVLQIYIPVGNVRCLLGSFSPHGSPLLTCCFHASSFLCFNTTLALLLLLLFLHSTIFCSHPALTPAVWSTVCSYLMHALYGSMSAKGSMQRKLGTMVLLAPN